eukprot:2539891-Amphidinium_carterae.3
MSGTRKVGETCNPAWKVKNTFLELLEVDVARPVLRKARSEPASTRSWMLGRLLSAVEMSVDTDLDTDVACSWPSTPEGPLAHPPVSSEW